MNERPKEGTKRSEFGEERRDTHTRDSASASAGATGGDATCVSCEEEADVTSVIDQRLTNQLNLARGF